MTTLAADKPRTIELDSFNEHPVVGTDIIYEGAAVGLSGSFARPLVAGDRFLGFAEARADNATGAAGDVRVKVRPKGLVVLPVTGVDGSDDLGKAVYASDDDTFTLTSTSNTLIGRVYRHVSGTTCVVDFGINFQAAA